jgi:predicted MFS family arabinose efflux permease
VVLLAVAAALLLGFVWIERHAIAPLVPERLVKLATVRGSNIVALLIGASLFSMFFFVSLYMQQVLGFSPIKTGLSYLPLALTIILSAGVASQLVTRLGFKPVLMAGLAFVAVGLLWFAQVSVDGSFAADVLGPSLLAGAGLGFAFVPVTIGAVSGIESDDAGLASGLINASQQIGGALGLAVLATIANGRTDDVLAAAGGDPAALPGALTEGFQTAFLVGAGFALLGLLLTAILISGSDSRRYAQDLAQEPKAAGAADAAPVGG